MGHLLWLRSSGNRRMFYDNFVEDVQRRQWAKNQPKFNAMTMPQMSSKKQLIF